MSQISVLGSMLESSTGIPWDRNTSAMYRYVYQALRMLDANVAWPMFNPELEARSDQEIVHHLFRGLDMADAVVLLFRPDNVPSVVETVYAALAGKAVLIVAEVPEKVPRILKGLSSVVGVFEPNRTGAIADAMRRELYSRGKY